MGTDCILCGGCVDICPVDCIEIVNLNILFDESNNSVIKLRPETDSADRQVLLIKKNDLCIRCGLCVRRCPVGTFMMEEANENEVYL